MPGESWSSTGRQGFFQNPSKRAWRSGLFQWPGIVQSFFIQKGRVKNVVPGSSLEFFVVLGWHDLPSASSKLRLLLASIPSSDQWLASLPTSSPSGRRVQFFLSCRTTSSVASAILYDPRIQVSGRLKGSISCEVLSSEVGWTHPKGMQVSECTLGCSLICLFCHVFSR